MEHPLFSLATKPDMRHLVYQNGENRLEIVPSGLGLPTIKDKDILIFCISQLMHMKNRARRSGKRVRFSARELSISTNRPIGATITSGWNKPSSGYRGHSSPRRFAQVENAKSGFSASWTKPDLSCRKKGYGGSIIARSSCLTGSCERSRPTMS